MGSGGGCYLSSSNTTCGDGLRLAPDLPPPKSSFRKRVKRPHGLVRFPVLFGHMRTEGVGWYTSSSIRSDWLLNSTSVRCNSGSNFLSAFSNPRCERSDVLHFRIGCPDLNQIRKCLEPFAQASVLLAAS